MHYTKHERYDLTDNGRRLAEVELMAHSGGYTIVPVSRSLDGERYDLKRTPVILRLRSAACASLPNGDYELHTGQSAPLAVRVVCIGFTNDSTVLEATVLEPPRIA